MAASALRWARPTSAMRFRSCDATTSRAGAESTVSPAVRSALRGEVVMVPEAGHYPQSQ